MKNKLHLSLLPTTRYSTHKIKTTQDPQRSTILKKHSPFPTLSQITQACWYETEACTVKSRAPKGIDKLEAFIADVEAHLIGLALDKDRAKEIRDIAAQTSDQDHVIVAPTGKMSSFTIMQTDKYKQKALRHLLKDGKEIQRERRTQAQEQAEELLKEINRLCSKGEREFVQDSLKSTKAITSPP
jgi:hypothetical protein